jgi:hypothetical protein
VAADFLDSHKGGKARPVAGSPVLLTGDGPGLALRRIDLAEGTHSEAWLQSLVFDQPQLLPIKEIEPGIGSLISVAMEVPCGHGFIDNLYVTSTGDVVLVEVKLWRNPQARREVVAQALDYVAALAAMSFEALEAACRKGKGMAGASLHALVADQADALGQAEFIDALSRNLARGRMLVLVLGDGIRSETQSLAGLLQGHAGAHFTLALVELALWEEPASGVVLAVPGTLAQTVMINRGVVTVEDGKALISAPTRADARPTSISEELFYEELGRRDEKWPHYIESFLKQIEPLGIYPEFRASLNLKADIAGYDKPLNFGYVTRAGKLWTDALSWFAGSTVARRYNETLASLIGGKVATYPNGNVYLSTNGKSAPLIGSLLPHHANTWADAIAEAIIALQLQAAEGGEGTLQPMPPKPAPGTGESGAGSLILSFEEAYEAGLPLIAVVNGEPYSPVMGFIRLPNGFAWCDDGILAQTNPGNPLHPVEGEVVERGSSIQCGHTELRPIDPNSEEHANYWKAAVAHFGSTEAMHAKAEKLLREMFAPDKRAGR